MNADMKKSVSLLMHKLSNDPQFGKQLKQNPESTLGNLGFKIDDEAQNVIAQINWNAKNLSTELQQRINKAYSGGGKK